MRSRRRPDGNDSGGTRTKAADPATRPIGIRRGPSELDRPRGPADPHCLKIEGGRRTTGGSRHSRTPIGDGGPGTCQGQDHGAPEAELDCSFFRGAAAM